MTAVPVGTAEHGESTFSKLAYALPKPSVKGRIRTQLSDFKVDEQLGFELTGSGEHEYLRIEKRGENTDDIARRLAKYAGVKRRDIGFAGLKDKHAFAAQWFSVHLPGKSSPDWHGFESDSIRVLEFYRHYRKLRRGGLARNCFEIIVRDLESIEEVEHFEKRLDVVSTGGVPNYFGPQRFGRQEQNIQKAAALFDGQLKVSGRHLKSLYLSAVRSYIFNQALSERTAKKCWNKAISGDALMLDASRAFFKPERLDDEIHRRVRALEIHPTGMLWGKGPRVVSDDALELEDRIVNANPAFCKGLEEFGLEMGRRSFRLRVGDMKWRLRNNTELLLSFTLPPGGYATAVMRELIEVKK